VPASQAVSTGKTMSASQTSPTGTADTTGYFTHCFSAAVDAANDALPAGRNHGANDAGLCCDSLGGMPIPLP
jgi:hypothetical protein